MKRTKRKSRWMEVVRTIGVMYMMVIQTLTTLILLGIL